MIPEERSLPLFPLNTVLFPGATMPLQIFEERYRRMLQDCLNELEARVRRGLANGDDEDAQRFGNEVREELAKYMGPERAIRYFEMFSASIDWEGVAFYLKRNP